MKYRSFLRRGSKLLGLYLLAVGAGYSFDAAGIPLPWLVGPLVSTAAASLSVGDMEVPRWTRSIGQVIVASAIGTNLTPSIVADLAANLGPMLAAGVVLILASALIAVALVKFSGVDKATALFAALPGGPMELALVAERYGGHGALVALSQMLRIAVIVTLVPFILLVGGHSTSAIPAQPLVGDPVRLAAIFGIGFACAVSLDALKITNAYFLGPLLGVGVATLAGLPGTPVPWPILITAQVLLGTTLGGMFTRGVFRFAAKFLFHAVLVAILITLIGVAIGLAAAFWTGQAPGVLVLANAPGGAAEMGILAKALTLNAALVTAYHLVRVIMIIPSAELIFRVFERMTRRL